MKKFIKPYKKEFDYSYTSGASVTIELLETRPDLVECIYIHSSFNRPDEVIKLCNRHGIPYIFNDSMFKRINQKENSYVLGIFRKFTSRIDPGATHVVLVNPADMGNLGTIIRTLTGFGINDLAIITPSADIWNPKTIRASMGSFFHMNFRHYDDINDYTGAFPEHRVYTFMTDGEVELCPGIFPERQPVSLVFGNEATGLGERFRHMGTGIKIPQSMSVDSLNLSVAVAVGVFAYKL